MTRDELVERLDGLGVPRDAYQLDGGPFLAGQWIVDVVGSRWSVWYADDRSREDEQFFTRAEDAYDRLFEEFSAEASGTSDMTRRHVTSGDAD